MKTKTRSQIIKIIGKNGKSRPVDLRQSLKLSAQAIHRHLRALTEEGVLETQGSPPFTQYSLAGVPDLETAFEWINARSLRERPRPNVCETRDVLTAGLPRLKTFVRDGLSPEVLPLVL